MCLIKLNLACICTYFKYYVYYPTYLYPVFCISVISSPRFPASYSLIFFVVNFIFWYLHTIEGLLRCGCWDVRWVRELSAGGRLLARLPARLLPRHLSHLRWNFCFVFREKKKQIFTDIFRDIRLVLIQMCKIIVTLWCIIWFRGAISLTFQNLEKFLVFLLKEQWRKILIRTKFISSWLFKIISLPSYRQGIQYLVLRNDPAFFLMEHWRKRLIRTQFISSCLFKIISWHPPIGKGSTGRRGECRLCGSGCKAGNHIHIQHFVYSLLPLFTPWWNFLTSQRSRVFYWIQYFI